VSGTAWSHAPGAGPPLLIKALAKLLLIDIDLERRPVPVDSGEVVSKDPGPAAQEHETPR
jgi:hypothetical protein